MSNKRIVNRGAHARVLATVREEDGFRAASVRDIVAGRRLVSRRAVPYALVRSVEEADRGAQRCDGAVAGKRGELVEVVATRANSADVPGLGSGSVAP